MVLFCSSRKALFNNYIIIFVLFLKLSELDKHVRVTYMYQKSPLETYTCLFLRNSEYSDHRRCDQTIVLRHFKHSQTKKFEIILTDLTEQQQTNSTKIKFSVTV